MPEFQERDPAHQRWKKQVLAGDVQLEEIDPADLTPMSLQNPKWKLVQRAADGESA